MKIRLKRAFRRSRFRGFFAGDFLVAVLIATVIGIATIQLYTHKTTALTPWKGGGFGMYTAAHPNHRSVWLGIRYEDDEHHVRLWPRDDRLPEFPGSNEKQSKESLDALVRLAHDFRFFPRDSHAAVILNQLDASGGVQDELIAAVSGIDSPGSPAVRSILVYQTEYEIDQQVIRNRELFSYSRSAIESGQ